MSKEKFVRDKPHVNIGTIAVVIIGALSAVSLGMTIYFDIMEERDSDGDTIPDLAEGNAGHPLFFDTSDDALFFRTYETGTSGHEVGHQLGLSHDGLSSHVNVQLGLLNDVSTAIPILDLNIKYDSLIEFMDGDSNGFFDPAFDTILGKTMLDNMVRLGSGFGVDGEPAYYSSYSTIDGIFKVDFYTAREHVLLGRQVGLLRPYELKSLITFTEYTPITGGTSLALNLTLSSGQGISFSGTNLSATLSTGNFGMVYEWYDWAMIDDVEVKVNTTVPSSSIPLNVGSIYLNFGGVINGSYDPKLHWQIPRLSGFNIANLPWAYITIGSIGITMIGTAAKIPRGKKKPKEEPEDPPSTKFDSIATHVQSTSESANKVPRKKPGRVTYQPISSKTEPSEKVTNSEETTRSEKRIPSTLRHRDR
ncbi:MAG: hypothetical protein ACW98A_17205 [Candidatus Hodarchaeales archaeon]|jgi:hypothetical protein